MDFIPRADRRVPHISLVFCEMWDTAGFPLKPAAGATDPFRNLSPRKHSPPPFVISTEANPDSILRAAGNDHADPQRHGSPQEIRGSAVERSAVHRSILGNAFDRADGAYWR